MQVGNAFLHLFVMKKFLNTANDAHVEQKFDVLAYGCMKSAAV